MYLGYDLITDYDLAELHANFPIDLPGLLINKSTSIYLLTKNEERN